MCSQEKHSVQKRERERERETYIYIYIYIYIYGNTQSLLRHCLTGAPEGGLGSIHFTKQNKKSEQ